MPAAARQLAFIHANTRHLRLQDLSLRYVRRLGPGPGATAQPPATRAWAAEVRVRWRIGGFDARSADARVRLEFIDDGHAARFASARSRDGHEAPLWLLEPLSSAHSRRALVVTAQPRHARPYLRLARRAVAEVDRVLTSWRGKLVVEIPRSQREMERTLGAREHAYDNIAAVTSASGGSSTYGAPAHVVVNPAAFGRLGPHGAQIVLTHEATHVATGAATSSMPMWLLEGFADYVALDHLDLPVSVTASQILADVAKHGPPAHLPGAREFEEANQRLGASYESAWLACRLLAHEYGEHRLVRLYREADREQATRPAFRKVLGTDQRTFTRTWRAYLRRLAG